MREARRVSAFRNFFISRSAESFSLFCVRDRAIRRHKQIKVAHVGVVCGEENAKVSGDASDNQSLSPQVAEQSVEGAGRKPECLGLSTK